MTIAITEYEDGSFIVSRRGEDRDDTVVRMTAADDDENWGDSGRVGTVKKVDEGGYEVRIDEDRGSYVYVTCDTLEEATEYAVHWVGLWPGGWCSAHDVKAEAK